MQCGYVMLYDLTPKEWISLLAVILAALGLIGGAVKWFWPPWKKESDSQQSISQMDSSQSQSGKGNIQVAGDATIIQGPPSSQTPESIEETANPSPELESGQDDSEQGVRDDAEDGGEDELDEEDLEPSFEHDEIVEYLATVGDDLPKPTGMDVEYAFSFYSLRAIQNACRIRHEEKCRYLLDQLRDMDYVSATIVTPEHGAIYKLTKSGRAYAVESGFLD